MRVIKTFQQFRLTESLKNNGSLLTESLPYNLAKEYTSIERNPAIVERMDRIFNRLEDLPGATKSRNGNRIYVPFVQEMVSPVKKEIEDVLNSSGFSLKDYEKGIAIDGYNREVKINRALNKIGRPDLINKVNADQHRTGKDKIEPGINNDLLIVFSRHAYDIAGMSTDRTWTSCMNLYDGGNKRYVQHDVKEGSIVCYLINQNDRNINKPILRTIIKPFINLENENEIIYQVEGKEYGPKDVPTPRGFIKQVKEIVESIQNLKLTSPFKLVSSLYCDLGGRLLWNDEILRKPAKSKEEVKIIMDVFIAAQSNEPLSEEVAPRAKEYTINEDLTVDVDGTFEIPAAMDRLPIKFGTIYGDFYADGCGLKTLEGFPKKVEGSFVLVRNKLTDLKGCPNFVGGLFMCSHNGLKSLKGSPEEVKDFYCHHNELTTLEDGPKIAQAYICDNNKLVNLKGCPKTLYFFDCKENMLNTLEGGPTTVDTAYYCQKNKLVNLKGAPETVREFICDDNLLTTLEGGPKRVSGTYSCNGNKLVNLIGAPKLVGHNFTCTYNNLKSLEGSPVVVGESFACGSNRITSLKGAPKKIGETFYCTRNPISKQEIEWAEKNIEAKNFVWKLSDVPGGNTEKIKSIIRADDERYGFIKNINRKP